MNTDERRDLVNSVLSVLSSNDILRPLLDQHELSVYQWLFGDKQYVVLDALTYRAGERFDVAVRLLMQWGIEAKKEKGWRAHFRYLERAYEHR